MPPTSTHCLGGKWSQNRASTESSRSCAKEFEFLQDDAPDLREYSLAYLIIVSVIIENKEGMHRDIPRNYQGLCGITVAASY